MRLSGLGGAPFGWLCAASLLFYLSFQLLLPVVPLYAAQLGAGEADVGLIIGVFAFAAMLLRPVAGELADRVGRRPLVVVGALVFATASCVYPLATSLAALLALRLYHGVGMGFGPTAATVMVADLAPPERRGAAMGLYGVTSTLGMAVGPLAGAEMARSWGFPRTFLAAAVLAVLSAGVAWRLPETRPAMATTPAAARSVSSPHLLSPARWFSRGALYPAALLLALFVPYGGVVALLPLFTERNGLGNPGLFFLVFAGTVVLTRTRAGHLADRVGRRLVVAPALAAAGAGLLALAAARTRPAVLLAALLFGSGFGAALPALLAMTGDRVPATERGRAMGTIYTAWELGIAIGSTLLGFLVVWAGYGVMWCAGAAAAWLGAAAALPGITRPRG